MKRVITLIILTLTAIFFIQCSSDDSTAGNTQGAAAYGVVIDVAHGGKDPGAIVNTGSASEKDIVLQISGKIKAELEKNDIRALLTREDDSFISLKDRIIMTEDSKAGLIISIHTNVSNDLTKSGYITFYQDNNSESGRLDRLVHEELNRLNLLKDNGSQAGPFYMLAESSVPAILIDLGYISNPKDLNDITNIDNQEKIAAALTMAVIEYQRK